MTTHDDSARQAHVKSVFGGELTDAERNALASFLETDEGREFRDCTDAFVDLLRGMDDDIVVPPAPTDLQNRFARHVREQARTFRRRFVRFCAGVYAFFTLGLLLPLVVPMRREMDAEGWTQLSIVMFGGATLFCAAMWWHNHRTLAADDVATHLAQIEGRVPAPRWRIAVRWTALVIVLSYLAHARWGWTRTLISSTAIAAVMLIFYEGIRAQTRRTRLAQNEELWSWWYEAE